MGQVFHAAPASGSQRLAPGPLGALDPRARILAAAAFAVVTVALDSLLILVIPLAMAVAALLAADLPRGQTLRRVAMVDGFILFLFLLLPFTVPGEAAFHVFSRSASWDGIVQAAAIALKANAIVLMLLSLVGSLEPTALGHALARLRVPERLVQLLLFTVRYVAVVDEQYRRQRRAMAMRGFRPGTNWHTLRSLGYLIGMLLVRALERSERILQAMKCRGFTGRLTLLSDMRFRRRDVLFAALLLPVLAGLLWLDRLHVGPA